MTAGHHHGTIGKPKRSEGVWLAAVLIVGAAARPTAAAPANRAALGAGASQKAAALTDDLAEHSATVDSAARGQLERILERPLYHRWKLRHRPVVEEPADDSAPSWFEPLQKWLADVGDAIGRWLDRWFGKREVRARRWVPGAGEGLGSALNLGGWMALGAVVLLLATFVYQSLRGVRVGRSAARVLSRAQVDAALEAGAALALESPQWLIEADRLARAGDLRAMYRALYLALLSGLHRRSRIDFRKTRTNWTYVARYRGPAEERDRFAVLTAGFDDAWYGGKMPPLAVIGRVREEVIAILGQEA